MRAIAIMYHDVVERDGWDDSGFPGADAALYKLGREQFAAHLEAIAAVVGQPPTIVSKSPTVPKSPDERQTPLFLTFDDGGRSAYRSIAGMLEAYGWRGHFFVTAGRLDAPTFLSAREARELHERGHCIGSHSLTHPARMSHCTPAELRREWTESIEVLSDALGERVRTASVPGGYYSRAVAEAAEAAGLETLFTSEPTLRVRRVGNCLVYGRYTVQRWMSPQTAAALAAGRVAPRLRQSVYWNAKKATKAVGGEYYLRLRRALLKA